MSKATHPPPLPPDATAAAAAASAALYERDHAAWLDRQAALLRSGRFREVDVPNLAEELEDMAKSQRQEVENRLVVLLHHLLKYEFQADQRSGSWRGTIGEQRRRIARLIAASPILKTHLDAAAAGPMTYEEAVDAAILETGLPRSRFPGNCPYALPQIMDRRFWPGPGPHPAL